MTTKIIVVSIMVSISLILIPSIVNVTSVHEEKLNIVTEKRIVEAAVLCIKESNCNYDLVFLKDLYEFNYLEKEYDPITKEYYNNESYILLDEEKTEFVSVN